MRGKKQSASPVFRAKRQPRGKRFPKGNTIGISTRFVKGVCPNPGGRPKSKMLSEALRAGLAADIDAPIVPQTNAEAVAARIIKLAKKGNISAAREAGDRSEGRPAQSLDIHDGRPDPLTVIAEAMNRRSAVIGPPEGSEFVIEAHERLALTDGDGELEEETA